MVQLNLEYGIQGDHDFDRVYGTFINDIKVLYRTEAPWWGDYSFSTAVNSRTGLLPRHFISYAVLWILKLTTNEFHCARTRGTHMDHMIFSMVNHAHTQITRTATCQVHFNEKFISDISSIKYKRWKNLNFIKVPLNSISSIAKERWQKWITKWIRSSDFWLVKERFLYWFSLLIP